MLVEDAFLYEKARSMAGKDVHDVYSVTGLYHMNIVMYNRKFEQGKFEELPKIKARVDKAERILRSFLVTGDIWESRRLIEDEINNNR